MKAQTLKLNMFSKNFLKFPKRVFGVSQNILNYSSPTNPRVFLSISKGGQNLGNMTFEVILFKLAL